MPDEPKDLSEYPEGDPRQFGYHAAIATVGAADVLLPGVGYALQQLVSHIVAEPLQKRRDNWFRQVGSTLADLKQRLGELDLDGLSTNEEFITTVHAATQSAMNTHSEARRRALCNAIANVALGMTLEDALRGRFMRYIDQFSEAHTRVLGVLSNPSAFPNAVKAAKDTYMGAQERVIRAEISAAEMDDATFQSVLDDLSAERLIPPGSMKGMVSQGSLLQKQSTPTGDRFLAFISSPTD